MDKEAVQFLKDKLPSKVGEVKTDNGIHKLLELHSRFLQKSEANL